MIGDTNDIVGRLRAVLPRRWFADDNPPAPLGNGASNAPVLTAVLTGLAGTWSWLYGIIAYVKLQTRIGSATDDFLDRISTDYFGAALPRRVNEGDDAYRARILAELQRTRGTRGAIMQVLITLTGRSPGIFEPARAADTGAWGRHLAYGSVGGWGNLSLPAQFFVTAYRPSTSGIPAISGWGSGGWGRGVSAYATLAMVQGAVTDADIYNAIATTIPAGVTAWVNISN